LVLVGAHVPYHDKTQMGRGRKGETQKEIVSGKKNVYPDLDLVREHQYQSHLSDTNEARQETTSRLVSGGEEGGLSIARD